MVLLPAQKESPPSLNSYESYSEQEKFFAGDICMAYTRKLKTAFSIIKEKGIKGIADKIYEKYIQYTRPYHFYRTLAPSKYKKELAIWFKAHTGHRLNWEYPTGFNQKIQYLKLYDSTPLKTKLVDKYQVKSWVAEKIGEQYVTPLLGVFNSFDEIDFSKLPQKFVLKGTQHGVIIVDQATMSVDDIRQKCHYFLTTNFAYLYGLELQYRDVPPRLIAEEFLPVNEIYDYKIWCFHGKPEFISVQYYINYNHTIYTNFYDTNWKLQHFSSRNNIYKEIKKPYFFDNLLEKAATLSQNFIFVRVDFYILKDNSIKFGEMTFTPMSGTISWNYPYTDEFFGKKLILPL